MISATVILPFLTAILLASLPRSPRETTSGLEHGVAVLGTLSTLAFSVALLFALQAEPGAIGTPLVERHEWAPSLGVSLIFRVDGINVFPVVATALLASVAVLVSRDLVVERVRLFLGASLVLESSLLGVLTAADGVLFLVFIEATVLSMYVLLALWGTRVRSGSIRLVAWASASVLAMLLTVVYVHEVLRETGTVSFDLSALGDAMRAHPPDTRHLWLPLSLAALGPAIMLPLFPVPRWIATACPDASPPADILLAALPGIGLYGFIRLALPLFPRAAPEIAPWLMALALLSVLVAGAVSLFENDARRLVFCFSMSHLGLALAGLLTFTVEGAVGSIVLLVNYSLSVTVLCVLFAALQRRRPGRRIADLRAQASSMPRFARALVLGAGSAVGIVPAGGLVGICLVTAGLDEVSGWLAFGGLVGAVLTAVSLSLFCTRILLPLRASRAAASPETSGLSSSDLRARELVIVLPLGLLMVACALFSPWLTERMTPAVQRWLEAFR